MPFSLQPITDYHRYCPGEEQIKISDAMCIGRRRINFPKCKGCRFNDDEKRAADLAAGRANPSTSPKAEKEKRDRITSIFKSSHVLGIYPDELDEELAWRIGQATAQFLRSELRGYDRSQIDKSTIVVGRDMRHSSADLTAALIEGIRAGGSPAIDMGMIDTPQIYFAVNHLTCCGGIQVTGGHRPSSYNGFQIHGQKGRPIGHDTGLTKICKIARNTVRHTTPQLAGTKQLDLCNQYHAFINSFLRRGGAYTAERPLRVVVDASNGMAGRWLPLLFVNLDWLEIIPLNFEHNGDFAHSPDPLIEANLAQLSDRLLQSQADFGACFDGDADRFQLVDQKGRAVPNDLVTALLAPGLLNDAPGSLVIYDLRSSRVVPEEIRKAGGVPRRVRPGHEFIAKHMADSKAVFGSELDGRFYFRDNWYCDSGMIAFALVLNLLAQTGKPLHELLAPLRRYARSGMREFQNLNPKETIHELAARYADAEIDYIDGITVRYEDWWFHVLPSMTEPSIQLSLETSNEKLLETKLRELSGLLGKPAEG